MKKLVSVLCLTALSAIFVLFSAVTTYSSEDESLSTPPVDSNNNKYYYGVYYNTLKKPSNPAIYNDWIFANNTSGGNISWYNEKNYFSIINTSKANATAYVYLYDTNGNLYNNDTNGIAITVAPYAEFGQTLDEFYNDISNNWDGDTPLEGFIKVKVPVNSGNGTVQPIIKYLMFEGNKWCSPSNPFDKYAHLTTYTLELPQVANKDYVNTMSGLTGFHMYINKWYNGDGELDQTGDVVNYLKIGNASEDQISVNVTYYDGYGDTTHLGDDNFNINGHGSLSYCPTASGFGLYSSAMAFENATSSETIFPFRAVVTVTTGNPRAVTGYATELRRNSGDIYDSIAINMPHLTK